MIGIFRRLFKHESTKLANGEFRHSYIEFCNKRIAELEREFADLIQKPYEAGRLSEINIQDRKSRKQHVRQVRNQVHERKRKEKLKVCPRCGGSLNIIDGQYGKFYGCSNYPRCKYKLSYRVR